MTNSRRYENAASLLHELEQRGLAVTAPIDVEKVVSLLGIQVKEDSLLEADDVIGKIEFLGEAEVPVVTINPIQNSYKPRRRFTLAHEIGHYCLHNAVSKRSFSDSRKTMSRSASYWDRYESEANSFAAQLLMPKNLIVSEGKRVLNEYMRINSATKMPTALFIEQMSTVFGVSNKAMEYRLKNLGIV